MAEPYSPRWCETTPDERLPWPQMSGTGVYSTAVFVVAAAIAIVLGFSPKFDFSQNRNLIVAAITLVLGTGDFALGGIVTANFGALLLWALLRRGG